MTATAFSICVPTYNRGRKALELVRYTVPRLEEGCELVIIDNSSHLECDAYAEVERQARASQGRLVYRRNDYNMGFHGNFLTSLKTGEGALLMVLSDEDRPNLEAVRIALDIVRDRPGTGVIRGSIAPLLPEAAPANTIRLADGVYPAGRTALLSHAFANNYFSGTIYNRSLLSRLGLIARLEKNLRMQQDYPHLYLEGLACAVTDVVVSSQVFCFEGAAQVLANGSGDYAPPYSVGSRMDQFIALRDCLREAVGLLGTPFNAELFCNVYVKLSAKFFRTVGVVNAGMYKGNRINAGVAVRAFAFFACAAIAKYEDCKPFQSSVIREIDKFAGKFGG